MTRVLFVVGLVILMGCGGGGSSPTAPTTSVATPPTPAPTPTPTPTTANIAGSYDLVFTASSSCASNLPMALRVVRYVATITQSGSQFQTSLSGGSFTSSTFTGNVVGQMIDRLSIIVGDTSFVAAIGGALFIASTSGSGTVSPAGAINGTFNGRFDQLLGGGGSCNAFDHQFQLTRRS